VRDPRTSVEKRVAMADIRGRFGYMKRALPNFIEVGRRLSGVLDTGRVQEATHIAADFAPYRSLFGEDLTAVRDELTAGAALLGDQEDEEIEFEVDHKLRQWMIIKIEKGQATASA
jgi:hypothetical protein